MLQCFFQFVYAARSINFLCTCCNLKFLKVSCAVSAAWLTTTNSCGLFIHDQPAYNIVCEGKVTNNLMYKCLPLVSSDIHFVVATLQPLTFVILADTVHVHKI